VTWTVLEAIHAASVWLERLKGEVVGYRGAWVAGSVARLKPHEVVPAGSDVDVMVIADVEGHLGKSIRDGLVIEGTVLPAARALDAQIVLGDYHLAPGLVHARILDDPYGDIARVQQAVLERYRDPATVRARLDHVEERVRATLASARTAGSSGERLNAWQFGVGQIAHMILVGALENPTVRKRYVAAARVMEQYGEEVAYERLLRLAGINRIARPAVEALARELDSLLMRVGPLAEGSTWRFASDIASPMRPMVMNGIRTMIAEGWHREAMFPVSMTWCRCAQLLEMESPEDVRRAAPVDLGSLALVLRVPDEEALTQFVADAEAAIPAFRALADRIAHQVSAIGNNEAV
jgi:hypothetical protein